MQERTEAILETASQALTFRSPWGRPTATPSVGTADSGNGELSEAADTNVTLDSVSTTIAATASAGAKSLTLTSATGVTVSKTYHLTNEYGQTEQAKVKKINSAVVTFVDPLMNDYDLVNGATYGSFEGVEFVYALQTADVAALAEMNVATATFTAGGLPRALRLVYDVVRVPLNAPGALTAEAVYERLGRDLARQEPDEQRGEDYEPQRKAAWNIVRRRIYQHGDAVGQWRPSMVVDASDLLEYAFAVFARVCHEQSIAVIRTDPPPTRAELLEAEEQERAIALNGISWLDQNEDKAKGEGESQPLELDFVR